MACFPVVGVASWGLVVDFGLCLGVGAPLGVVSIGALSALRIGGVVVVVLLGLGRAGSCRLPPGLVLVRLNASLNLLPHKS